MGLGSLWSPRVTSSRHGLVVGQSRPLICTSSRSYGRLGPARATSASTGVEKESTVSVPGGRVTTNDDYVPELTNDMWSSFLRPYRSNYEECAFTVTDEMVEGRIPVELKGTLLRNGPGLFEIGGKKIPQPFDGDGKVAMFSFGGDGANPFFSTRFVRTEAFVEEQKANKMLYRGAFSVGNPAGGWLYNPFDLRVKQIANTGVVRWAGKVLALYERDLPYELRDADLKTSGRTDLGGAIDSPYFSAHNRIVTERDGSRRLVAFSSSESMLDNQITVWEFDEAGRQVEKVELRLPGAAFGFFHDVAVTENYYIFLENSVRLDLKKFGTKYMFGKACIAECLEHREDIRSKVHLIPRRGEQRAQRRRTLECPSSMFSFHHVNAYEDGDMVVLDTCGMRDGFDFSANMETTDVRYYESNKGRGAYIRLMIDLASGRVREHKLMERACDFPCVAPSVVGKKHSVSYVYGSAANEEKLWGPPQVVVKLSFVDDVTVEQTVYNPGKDRWCQEPIFVPRTGGEAEDDGWIMCIVYDSAVDRSQLVILDAKSMGVEAIIKLPFAMPPGLHGSWANDAYLGPSDASAFEMKYDIRNGVV
jgi:all-trans-8'-apo-beta-carotenal 15,15'-oxygenase